MVQTTHKTKKITITVPFELKEQVYILKDELKTSISAIYKDALKFYIKQREIEKWEKGAKLASKDKQYLEFVNDISDDGDIYEY